MKKKLKFVYLFINAVIGWSFNILDVLCQIAFPSCTLSDMDRWLSVDLKAMYILNIRQFTTMHQWFCNVAAYRLALLFNSLVNTISVI